MDGAVSIIAKYGLPGVTAICLGLVAWVLKWVLTQQREILNQAREERNDWKATIDTLNSGIQGAVQRYAELREDTKEGYKYIRKEHKEMLKMLQCVKDSLLEVCSALKGMNGNLKKKTKKARR